MNIALQLAALLTSRRLKKSGRKVKKISEWKKKSNFSEWHVRPCGTLSRCWGLCGSSPAADSFKPGLPALKHWWVSFAGGGVSSYWGGAQSSEPMAVAQTVEQFWGSFKRLEVLFLHQRLLICQWTELERSLLIEVLTQMQAETARFVFFVYTIYIN